jgi:hypothetical protein
VELIQRSALPGRSAVACALALASVALGIAARAADGTGGALAKAARRVSLVETAHLKLTAERGAALVERGQAVGTYNAPVAVTLTIHPKSVTASVTIYPAGGSISGSANANYVIKNSVGYFGGTFTLGHGTGKFRHIAEVNGKPLGISGSINRFSFAMEVKAHGEANV